MKIGSPKINSIGATLAQLPLHDHTSATPDWAGLPAGVWGQVLDHLDIDDIRRCAMVNRALRSEANDLPRLVKALRLPPACPPTQKHISKAWTAYDNRRHKKWPKEISFDAEHVESAAVKKFSWSKNGTWLGTDFVGYHRLFNVEEPAVACQSGPDVWMSLQLDAVASTKADTLVSLRNLDGFNPSHVVHLTHVALVQAADWSHDGKNFAYCGQDGALTVYSAREGFAPRALNEVQPEQMCLKWSPDGTRLAVSEWQKKQLTLYDANDAVMQPEIKAGVLKIFWNATSSHMALLHLNGITVVRAHDGKGEELWNEAFTHEGIQWSPDGQGLAVGAYGGVWLKPLGGAVRALHTGARPRTMAWSPDSRYLMFATDNTCGVIEVASGKNLYYGATMSAMTQIAWSHCGRQIAYGDKKGAVHLLDTRTFVERSLGDVLGSSAVSQLSWSYDMSQLAAGWTNGDSKVYDFAA